mgnify:CR=1 FL=1|jgi:hypothetical protein
MARSLYLHEVVDIVGQGQYDYMEHLWKDPVLRMPDMFNLQGSFYVCAPGGGRWPQVVNIWDIGNRGWDGWASNVDRLNLKRRKAFYSDWWDVAATWRTGGFDRLLGGVPGSPTTDEIEERGIRGSIFVHEVLEVDPARRLEFLGLVADRRVAMMADHGHQVTGIYEVLGNLHEVVVVWATTVAAQTELRKSRDAAWGLDDAAPADERLREWEITAAGFVTGGITQLMTPLPRTVYGPPDWEDASLEGWISDTDQPTHGPIDPLEQP